jgi:hypothetical protein
MKYSIPSATDITCLTQTEIEALKYPIKGKVSRTAWKDIPGEELKELQGFGPNYYISNFGRVKHIKENLSFELKGNKNYNGRHLSTSNPRNQKQISRLVLEYFGSEL